MSLRCTLVRGLVQAASVLVFVQLSSNSGRVRLHIRFCRCTSSVGDVPPSILTLLVGDTATASVSLCSRRCSTTYSTTHFSRHTSLTGVLPSSLTVLANITFDSDDISSFRVAVVIVRLSHRPAIFRIVLFYLQNAICVNHHHHRHHRVCTKLL